MDVLQTQYTTVETATQPVHAHYADMESMMIFWVLIAIISAIVTMAIARHNERSGVLGFLAGFFLGPLGIATYAIMGETIALRVRLEEAARAALLPAVDEAVAPDDVGSLDDEAPKKDISEEWPTS